MITTTDFSKKQIAFAFVAEGEKMALLNDNFIIKDKDEKIKFQATCYRLFLVYVVGHCSLTTPLIQSAKKFGFFFVLMTTSFRPYAIIGGEKDGNTLLKEKQYSYHNLDIAKHITKNKIRNQRTVLKNIRYKTKTVENGIGMLSEYESKIDACQTLNEIMAYEGLSSKAYFERLFTNFCWKGRQPRLKRDIVNSSLDIGYTLLFGFVESLLSCYGFDTFCGVMHCQFYMRKSLVCDIEEPFRVIIDTEVHKAINLNQIQEKDFLLKDNRYLLKWENNSRYVKFLMQALLEEKDEIFLYIQSYYRAFMKGIPADEFPDYDF